MTEKTEEWPGGGEEFNLLRLPANPRLMETFQDYWTRLRSFIGRTTWPPKTEFICRCCGDCCSWGFWILTVEPSTVAVLRKYSGRTPHGDWLLVGDRIEIRLFFKEEGKVKGFRFPSSELSSNLLEFFEVTGRFHGYWVLNTDGRIVAYSPVKCPHQTEDNLCGIYETRPKVCRDYICRRWPILP